MAFQLSPGVLVKETDLTNIIPAVSTSIGGVVIVSEKGPIEEITQISSDDFIESTYLAKEMITRYGFSDLGLTSYQANDTSVFLGKDLLSNKSDISEKTVSLIDKAVITLLKQSLDKAIDILAPLTFKLDQLSDILLEQETMSSKQFLELAEIKPQSDAK